MKKIFMMLSVLFIIYISIQLGFRFFGSGHEYEYIVNNGDKEFIINEIFTNNTKNEVDSYYFEIKVDNNLFTYQTYESFNKSNQIIKNIFYYEDSTYKCILPIFLDNRILTDIMCLKNDVIYNYSNISGNNKNLDSFVNTLGDYGYNVQNYENKGVSTDIQGLTFYKENYVDGQFLTIETYKGIYTINDVNLNKPKKVEIFEQDVYKRDLSIVFKNYYVVANYNSKYRFDKFYMVDLTSNKVTELECGREISFDSYFQGTQGNSIYLFDRDSKKQYEINLNSKTVLEVGNEKNDVKVFRNGNWEKVSAISAKRNDELFDNIYNNNLDNKNYVKIDKVGGEKTGYYYFYKKNGANYDVYRSTTYNNTQLTYLFSTADINRVEYINDYVYYVFKDEIRYFSDSKGIKTLLKDKELSFNKDLKFNLYKK